MCLTRESGKKNDLTADMHLEHQGHHSGLFRTDRQLLWLDFFAITFSIVLFWSYCCGISRFGIIRKLEDDSKILACVKPAHALVYTICIERLRRRQQYSIKKKSKYLQKETEMSFHMTHLIYASEMQHVIIPQWASISIYSQSVHMSYILSLLKKIAV